MGYQGCKSNESLTEKVYINGQPFQYKMYKKTRTAIYIRVSTVDQKPDLQIDGLYTYAKRAELEIVQKFFDVGMSGRKQNRSQIEALMQGARNLEFNCVLVWKFDRFARSTKHLLTALEEFDYLGIRFVSVQDQIDTTSPMGKAMFTLIGAISELESSLISERVKAGMKAAKSRGKRLGRPTTPLYLVRKVEYLAKKTELSVRKIHKQLNGKVSRGVVGDIVKGIRNSQNTPS